MSKRHRASLPSDRSSEVPAGSTRPLTSLPSDCFTLLPSDCFNEVLAFLRFDEASRLMPCARGVRTSVARSLADVGRVMVFPPAYGAEKKFVMLREACRQGVCVRGVDMLYDSTADDLLSIAACEDSDDVADLLLRVAPDVNVDTAYCQTRESFLFYTSPLGYAAQNGSLRVLRRLLQEEDIDINHASPLVLAAMNGHLPAVELLLGVPRVDPNAVALRHTALSAAAERGHLAIVDRLLRHPGVDVNKFQPLAGAAACGHLAVVRRLAREVPALDVGDGQPMEAAAGGGHLPVVKYLLELNVDVNDADRMGRNPLRSAVANAHVHVVEHLLRRADVDVNEGAPLCKAASIGHAEMVALFLKRDDVDVNGGGLSTPLAAAAQGAHADVMRLLLADERTRANGHAVMALEFAAAINGAKEV